MKEGRKEGKGRSGGFPLLEKRVVEHVSDCYLSMYTYYGVGGFGYLYSSGVAACSIHEQMVLYCMQANGNRDQSSSSIMVTCWKTSFGEFLLCSTLRLSYIYLLQLRNFNNSY
jgi:hypothetical protein